MRSNGRAFHPIHPLLDSNSSRSAHGKRLRIRARRLRCCRSGDLMLSPCRFLIVFLAFLASASVVRSAVAAQAYLIADAQTGYILEEQEPRKKLQVGSLTKIATACVVLDWSEKKSGDLNGAVTIPPEAFQGTTENNIGFQPGDSVTLRDLLMPRLCNLTTSRLTRSLTTSVRSWDQLKRVQN